MPKSTPVLITPIRQYRIKFRYLLYSFFNTCLNRFITLIYLVIYNILFFITIFPSKATMAFVLLPLQSPYAKPP